MMAKAGGAFALCRLMLWFFAVVALAEVPLGTGLKPFPLHAPTSVHITADVGEERSAQLAGPDRPWAETAADDRDPLITPAFIDGEEPVALPVAKDRSHALLLPLELGSNRATPAVQWRAPEQPFARGPPGLA